MKLEKVQYREYCFKKPNKLRYEGYFKNNSINYYLVNNTTIAYCVWYNDKKFYI